MYVYICMYIYGYINMYHVYILYKTCMYYKGAFMCILYIYCIYLCAYLNPIS